MSADLTTAEEAALANFARDHGRNWKNGLYQLWKDNKAKGPLRTLGRKKQAQKLVKAFKYRQHSPPGLTAVAGLYYGPLS